MVTKKADQASADLEPEPSAQFQIAAGRARPAPAKAIAVDQLLEIADADRVRYWLDQYTDPEDQPRWRDGSRVAGNHEQIRHPEVRA